MSGATEKSGVTLKGLIEMEQRSYIETYERLLTESGQQQLLSGDLTVDGDLDGEGWELLAVEVLVAIDPEEHEDLPEIYRFDRLDILLRKGEENTNVRVVKSDYFDFDPISFELNSGTAATLFPFHWHYVEFGAKGITGPLDAYEAWAEKWLDVKDEKTAGLGARELGGVVHGVYLPEERGDRLWFEIDFGSAEASSFWELLHVLSAMGASDIRIGSFTIIEELDGEQQLAGEAAGGN